MTGLADRLNRCHSERNCFGREKLLWSREITLAERNYFGREKSLWVARHETSSLARGGFNRGCDRRLSTSDICRRPETFEAAAQCHRRLSARWQLYAAGDSQCRGTRQHRVAGQGALQHLLYQWLSNAAGREVAKGSLGSWRRWRGLDGPELARRAPPEYFFGWPSGSHSCSPQSHNIYLRQSWI